MNIEETIKRIKLKRLPLTEQVFIKLVSNCEKQIVNDYVYYIYQNNIIYRRYKNIINVSSYFMDKIELCGFKNYKELNETIQKYFDKYDFFNVKLFESYLPNDSRYYYEVFTTIHRN